MIGGDGGANVLYWCVNFSSYSVLSILLTEENLEPGVLELRTIVTLSSAKSIAHLVY